ncbi:hypothetical protein SteCoe_22582 [Stentor coeruleus]|uniref:Uncharacterized protein n=1 Tax=Stentor coeruleus TaxID=5963 RepID=A0A1R2BLX3_9CILI|nr:hypothetical protein SteCoe_22582 [Stentor coeruleus]
MESLKNDYLLRLDIISERDKESIRNGDGKKIQFNIVNEISISIHEYDCQKNTLFADVLVIETSFYPKCDSKEIRKKITAINQVEFLGVFIYDSDSKKVSFRTTGHCAKNRHVDYVSGLLEEKDGHFTAPLRFNNFIVI